MLTFPPESGPCSGEDLETTSLEWKSLECGTRLVQGRHVLRLVRRSLKGEDGSSTKCEGGFSGLEKSRG